MRLPRWTVWPALAVLAAFLVPGVTRRAPEAPKTAPRVVVLGIDGMDPELLREAIQRFPDRMRNFARLADANGIHSLRTSVPPQSPVAWSNFITGRDPGGHGIFDFIHRDPTTRMPIPSTVKASAAKAVPLPDGWQFPVGGNSESNRTGAAFWSVLRDRGVPADIWRMPANFPVEGSEGWSFSGMMTPAIDSAYGKYTYYTSQPDPDAIASEGRIVAVREFDGRIDTSLSGPANPFKKDGEPATIPLRVLVDHEAGAAAIELAGRVVVVPKGAWSDWVQVKFDLLPLGMSSVHGIVRFHVKSLSPFELYASPVNIDPTAPIAPVSEPAKASAEVARRIGLYYTQGMPEDVNALKEGVLTDAEFLAQGEVVHQEGVRMLDLGFQRWKERGGFLFFYFSGVDLCGHMLWRHHDAGHPNHDAQMAAESTADWSHRPGSTWKDVIFDLYMRMDPVVGRLLDEAGSDATVIVMSDHGFESYRRKFSLNTWLLENGYLVLKEGREREKPESDPAREAVVIFDAVDWTKTRAYGVGFNGLYLNLKGRELDDPHTADVDESGIVAPGAEADALVAEIDAKLLAIRDGDARPVLRNDRPVLAYHGERAVEAPDLIVGYNANYGNSDESSLGRIPHDVLTDNLGGTFQGSHLMAPEVVPGLLLSTRPVREGAHGLEDLTVEILKQYGIEPVAGMRGAPVLK
ncbi:MAG: alkaline phosphatase family protein [Planctomycetota bacterium]|nr:alkaline phosphatase family protein [Planctomycetota bacterium]